MPEGCSLRVDADVAAIVFDLDGTLYVNRDLAGAIHCAACRFVGGLLAISPEEADLRIREEKAKILAETSFAAPLSGACRRLGVDIRGLHAFFAREINPEPFLSADDDVIDLLRELSPSIDLVVYTNNNRTLTSRILQKLGMAELFRRIYTIEDSWQPKPNLGFLQSIVADIGLPPERLLFVGDRYDIDLRLPEGLGAQVLLTRTVDDLQCLRRLVA